MSRARWVWILTASVFLVSFGTLPVRAQQIKKVFVIAMENHNWTQPAQVRGEAQPLYKNPNAPFLNNLVNGTASAVINGAVVNISKQVAYATAYHNVLATATGKNPHIHPSEPNYMWAEAGANFGVLNDHDPYTGGTNQNTSEHLSSLLTRAGKAWRSYQEDVALARNGGSLTNVAVPQGQWSVPLTSYVGQFAGPYKNAYNGSNQYNYVAKHNPMVFFSDTNGGNDASPKNPLSSYYAPLQQLEDDLARGTVADYNWISPDNYNDMHTPLDAGYKGLTGDAASVRQGDDFLSKIVPVIMSSDAYKNDGLIVIWFDETEEDGARGDNPDDFQHTIPEIIISPRGKPNVNGLPYASALNYTHSSDLRTMQEIFGVGNSFLGDAAKAIDLSDLFAPGAIPSEIVDAER